MELISYKIYIKRVIMVPFGIQIFMLKFIRNYNKQTGLVNFNKKLHETETIMLKIHKEENAYEERNDQRYRCIYSCQ